MLTYDELLGQVRQLNAQERLALIEAITQMLKEDLLSQSKLEVLEPNSHSTISRGLRPIEELQGSLNPQGRPYSDEELDDLK